MGEYNGCRTPIEGRCPPGEKVVDGSGQAGRGAMALQGLSTLPGGRRLALGNPLELRVICRETGLGVVSLLDTGIRISELP